MRADQLAIALVEAGFSVRSMSEESVTARHSSPRVRLTATVLPDESWHVKAFAPSGLPGVDAVLRTAADVISLLSSAYTLTPRRIP